MHRIAFLMIWFCMVISSYADDRSGNNPGVSLDPQDVPIFYDNNPLSGMKSFTVITSLPLKDVGRIEKMLETVGLVTHLKDNDMRGFGAGNVLLIQIGKVTGWDGSETSMTRLSLSVETSVTLDKTDIKTFPIVWSINSFLPGPIDSSSEGNLTKAVQKLVSDFVQNYEYANPGQAKRPVFYVYN